MQTDQTPSRRGLHHVSAVVGNPQTNIDFYQYVLGQRLVKTTVNFEDPGMYHLYYGDHVGSPGTIFTFFPWHDLDPGRRGNRETVAVAYAAPEDSLGYWSQRLESAGVTPLRRGSRFDDEWIGLCCPSGMNIELVAVSEPSWAEPWPDSPIPSEHTLSGFRGVTLHLSDVEGTSRILTDHLGYQLAGELDNRFRHVVDTEHGPQYVDIEHRPDATRARFGSGSVHHVAFRAADRAEQLAIKASLEAAGQLVTDIKDRQYFRSVYFRTPGGVLFEIATDPPGFTIDEPVEDLGSELRLPAWLERRRSDIVAGLPALDRGVRPIKLSRSACT